MASHEKARSIAMSIQTKETDLLNKSSLSSAQSIENANQTPL
jgi:hypothetical protein